jgi:hypothetical protein
MTEQQKKQKLETDRRWRANNRQRHLANRKRWRQANRTALRAKGRDCYHRNAAHCKAQALRWRAANPERFRATRRKYGRRIMQELSPVYVKQMIRTGTNLRNRDIPDAVVQLAAQIIKLKRLCRNHSQKSTPPRPLTTCASACWLPSPKLKPMKNKSSACAR